MKNIPFKKKNTSATTQYNETLSADTQWVLNQSKRLVDVATQCEKHKIIEGARLNAKNPNIPRMSAGTVNTCATMCQGVIDNFNDGQYNLSEKQIIGITEAFRVGEEIIEDFESVTFEEVDKLPKLKSTISIPPSPNMESTLSDLFDIDSITVTYKRKAE